MRSAWETDPPLEFSLTNLPNTRFENQTKKNANDLKNTAFDRKLKINGQHGSSASLGGKADDRAEAPAGGLWRTASWVHEKP